jgi:hypothetical protein
MDHRCVPNKSIVLAITLQNHSLINTYLAKNGCIIGFLTKWSMASQSGHCLYNTTYY